MKSPNKNTMRILFTLTFLSLCSLIQAQTASIQGQLQDEAGAPVSFANVVLHTAADSSIYKVEVSDETGVFKLQGLNPGQYFLKVSYVGAGDLNVPDINLKEGQALDLEVLKFAPSSIELETATVTAARAMVEIKPDRTVFNVQGTINAVGDDAISLLRKAPGVTVDNNNNISVLGRSGVLLYVDGKRLPIVGDDLVSFLQSLTAEQIDRIDIITNPGARYEAEGNAGIIDIRLKKDKNSGFNGSVTANYNQGRYDGYFGNTSFNYRNKTLNVFAQGGGGSGGGYNDMFFKSNQNGLFLDEINQGRNFYDNYNARVGVDFFLNEKNTIGVLAGIRGFSGNDRNTNRIQIAQAITPTDVDSILVAQNTAESERDQNTFNINYRFDNGKGRVINVDLDYGRYENDNQRNQPNRYFDANEEVLLTEVINFFDTPTDIDIYTFKIDFEEKLFGGNLSFGSKLSRVVSDNTFLFYDVEGGVNMLNNQFSNRFEYTENVYAGYINFARQISEKWNFSAGLRAEQTDALGDLQAFLPELQEDPVDLNYLSWFPSAGLTWQVAPQHLLALNYGRRINRPDYNVLNPFENRLSELTFEKGNPFLNPEIVNNIELGYTLAYRYNFKLAYSKTTDQITRLIAPDDMDERASFITWANLAEQTVYSFNISAPVQVTEKWNAFINFNASHIDNQADYGDGAIVDVQAFSYNIFAQNTIDLPFNFKGEVSGWFSGPGVWGGVFEYNETWSLNLGLQRKFFSDKLNVRMAFNDIFFKTGWNGVSEFNGLVSTGRGNWDSRRFSINLNYSFGNQKIKSRKRKTGLEEEAGRVGG